MLNLKSMLVRYGLFLSLLAAVTVYLSSCAPSASEDIKTPGLYCSFSVDATNGLATASAVFRTGNPLGTNVVLSEGDEIRVNGVLLAYVDKIVVKSYDATFPAATEYSFVLTRPGESPYTCTLQSPPAVTITSPAEGASISRQSSFDVTWENNGSASSTLSLILYGAYLNGLNDNVPDTGTFTIPANTLNLQSTSPTPTISPTTSPTVTPTPSPTPTPATTTTEARIILSRTTTGTMDPALNGTITGRSYDQVNIVSTP